MDWSLEGLESFKAHNAHVSAVHELVDALQVGSRKQTWKAVHLLGVV